ncbi:MAG: cupin domain-containing protein [Alphaproteobacteria bacterium]|nr:cupin domain-containing protein [Alphaproteobacteria bacterium]MBL7096051.1 cupin domain-containing protein [Alphaproteobacteria bacterium]
MSIAHHPGDELLLSYASGAANEAVALLVASHATFCAQCRARVQRAEATGGRVLTDMAPVPMSAQAYESLLARLDEPARAVVQAAHLQSDVPAPLQAYIGTDYGALPWRHVGGGISHLPIRTRGGMRARLIRAEPGSGVYTHTHKGEEWTLVLTGSYTDKTGHYAAGDVQSTTPEISHQPTADAGPVCINLAVTDAPLVFRGLLPKLVAKFHGF